jgi:hypothetical protein
MCLPARESSSSNRGNVWFAARIVRVARLRAEPAEHGLNIRKFRVILLLPIGRTRSLMAQTAFLVSTMLGEALNLRRIRARIKDIITTPIANSLCLLVAS